MQDQGIWFGVARELHSEQVGDLALVPAEERADRREARDGPARGAAPHKEVFALPAAREIAQLDMAGCRVPGVGHLHAAAGAQQLGDRGGKIRRLDRRNLDAGDPTLPNRRAHGSPGDSEGAIEVR